MEKATIMMSIVLIIFGMIGTPSPLNQNPNTATLLYLTGFICLILSLNNL